MAELLSRRCAEGYLSVDTLAHRVEAVYAARTVEQLDAVMVDLPRWWWQAYARGVTQRIRAIRAGAQTAVEELVCIDQILDLSALVGAAAPLILGRDDRCGLVIDHPSVSRRHAELVVLPEQCRVRDLGSTYGTKVAGTTVTHTVVEPGATVVFGDHAVQLTWVAVGTEGAANGR